MASDSILRTIVITANLSFIIIVAKKGMAEDWAAYMGVAPGGLNVGDAEVEHVMQHGWKLPESWAQLVFPEIELRYRS